MKKNKNIIIFNCFKKENNRFLGRLLTVFNGQNVNFYIGSFHYTNLFQENLQIIYANIRV